MDSNRQSRYSGPLEAFVLMHIIRNAAWDVKFSLGLCWVRRAAAGEVLLQRVQKSEVSCRLGAGIPQVWC
jgi:hypothetical protein